MILFKCFLQRRDLRRNVNHIRACTIGFQHKMVVLIIACLHRLKGIAVVRVFQRQNHRPLLIAAVHIILQRHFQRYLNRHAAGI